VVANLIECEKLAGAPLSRGGLAVQQLGLQLSVWILLGQSGDDVLHLYGITVVQLREDVAEFCLLFDDTSQNVDTTRTCFF
jgi:hypothetical protein